MKKNVMAALGGSATSKEMAASPLRSGGKPLSVPLALLDESPEQLRIDITNIEELAASMASAGLIQPISVSHTNGRYTINAGHRRVEAAKLLGWQHIDAVLSTNKNTGELSIKGLIENIQRENLSALELALAVDRAMAAADMKPSEFCKSIGKDATWLSKVRSILTLPQAVLDSLALGMSPKERQRLGVEALSELSRLEDEELCVSLFEQLKKGEIRREGMREAIREAREPKQELTPDNKTENTDGFEMKMGVDDFKKLMPQDTLPEQKSKPISYTAVLNIPIKTDVPHTEPEMGKIGRFWDFRGGGDTRVLSFNFRGFSAELYESFRDELLSVCEKYENMDIQ